MLKQSMKKLSQWTRFWANHLISGAQIATEDLATCNQPMYEDSLLTPATIRYSDGCPGECRCIYRKCVAYFSLSSNCWQYKSSFSDHMACSILCNTLTREVVHCDCHNDTWSSFISRVWLWSRCVHYELVERIVTTIVQSGENYRFNVYQVTKILALFSTVHFGLHKHPLETVYVSVTVADGIWRH